MDIENTKPKKTQLKKSENQQENIDDSLLSATRGR